MVSAPPSGDDGRPRTPRGDTTRVPTARVRRPGIELSIPTARDVRGRDAPRDHACCGCLTCGRRRARDQGPSLAHHRGVPHRPSARRRSKPRSRDESGRTSSTVRALAVRAPLPRDEAPRTQTTRNSALRGISKGAPPSLARGRGPTNLTMERARLPSRPSRGLSSGATRKDALRRPTGPFMGLRGAPRTPTRLAGRTWVPSARTAFRRPRGIREPGAPGRIAPVGGPPCTFATLQRSIAAPPHRPAGPRGSRLSDDASSRRLCCPTTRTGTADPFAHGASGPAPCHVRGLVTSFAASTTDPANLLAKARASTGFSLQGVLLAPIGPPFGSLDPPGVSRGIPKPLAGPRTRGRLQGVDPGASSFCPSDPEGPGASMPSWASSLQSVRPLRPAVRFDRARLPHHALGGLTSRPACVSRSCDAERSDGPLSGPPALLGFSTLRPSRPYKDRAGSGFMASPHGARSLHSLRADPCPLAAIQPRPEGPGQGRRPSVNGCYLFQSSEPVFSKNVGRKASGVPNGAGRPRPWVRICDPFMDQRLRAEGPWKVIRFHQTTADRLGMRQPRW